MTPADITTRLGIIRDTAEDEFTHDTVDAAIARIAELEGALKWYAEQARLCRLITSEGDVGRNALDKDGGDRARAALAVGDMTTYRIGEETGQPPPNRDINMLLAECKRLRALLDAQWQPIETAPKDGRRVLLCCKCQPKVISGSWDGTWWVDDAKLIREPLQWQPLPNPPVSP